MSTKGKYTITTAVVLHNGERQILAIGYPPINTVALEATIDEAIGMANELAIDAQLNLLAVCNKSEWTSALKTVWFDNSDGINCLTHPENPCLKP
jgi:hypothetical protein